MNPLTLPACDTILLKCTKSFFWKSKIKFFDFVVHIDKTFVRCEIHIKITPF